MKYTITLLFLILTSSINVQAQIKNAGFENINPDSSIQFWAQSCFYSIGVGDSIMSNGATIASSSDAHSGQRAIKLQNSYNVTQNRYYGACMLSNNDSAGQASFINHFPIDLTPGTLTFYYKFDSVVAGDSAEVSVTIGAPDSISFPGMEIGAGSIKLFQKNGSYVLVTVPITYSQNLVASFATLKINTYTENSTPHFGTILLLDDFSFNASLSITDNFASTINAYPNPANGIININVANPATDITIYNNLGQMQLNKKLYDETQFSINSSQFANGIYIAQIRQQAGVVSRTRVAIQH
jgi:hypothetical protein